jgi:hypothetical protein
MQVKELLMRIERSKRLRRATFVVSREPSAFDQDVLVTNRNMRAGASVAYASDIVRSADHRIEASVQTSSLHECEVECMRHALGE